MELELHQKLVAIFHRRNSSYTAKLEFHGKLEFKKSGRSLIILQTMVDPYIFYQIVILGPKIVVVVVCVYIYIKDLELCFYWNFFL